MVSHMAHLKIDRPEAKPAPPEGRLPPMASTLEKCTICLEAFTGDINTLPCAHRFHAACIGQWLNDNDSCPLCRTPTGEPPSSGAAADEDLGMEYLERFLNPVPTEFEKIPPHFGSEDGYLSSMEQNNMAEFWAIIKHAAAAFIEPVVYERVDDTHIRLPCSAESINGSYTQHLLKVEGRYHIVKAARTSQKITLMLKGIDPLHSTAADLCRRFTALGCKIDEADVKIDEATYFIQIELPVALTRIDFLQQILSDGIATAVQQCRSQHSAEGSVTMEVHPALYSNKRTLKVEDFGFIGAQIQQNCCIQQMRAAGELPSLLKAVADPRICVRGDYSTRPIETFISPEFVHYPINTD